MRSRRLHLLIGLYTCGTRDQQGLSNYDTNADLAKIRRIGGGKAGPISCVRQRISPESYRRGEFREWLFGMNESILYIRGFSDRLQEDDAIGSFEFALR